MSFWDDLGSGLLGAGAGYISSGGNPWGAAAGGVGTGLSGNHNLFQDALMGAGAGATGGMAANKLGLPSDLSGLSQYLPSFGSSSPTWMPGQGWSDMQGGGWGGLSNPFSGLSQYLPSLGGLSGLFGGGSGGQNQSQPGQPQQGGQSNTGGFGDWGGLMGGNGGMLSGLGMAGGMGLLAAGMASPSPHVDLTSAFQGQQGQTNQTINDILGQQNPEYQNAINQYMTSRGQGAQSLDQTLAGNAPFQMQNSLRTIGDRLNSMGLMNGPSGAMNEALAQAAGQIKSEALPYEARYGMQTQQGLNELQQGQLQNMLGLQQSGMQRNFGLTDLMTNASLKQQLLNAQQQANRQQGLIGAGATLFGAGLGGVPGMMAASQMGLGGNLAKALAPSADFGSGGYGGGMGGMGRMGGYGGGYGGGMY